MALFCINYDKNCIDWEMMTAEDKELVSKMIEDLGELRKGKGGGAKAGQTPKSARKRAKKEEDDEEEDEVEYKEAAFNLI